MIKQRIIDFIFPPKCMFCGDVVAVNEQCTDCRKKAEFYKIPKTNRQINSKNFKKLDRCISFYRYEDMIRDSIICAKFENCCAFVAEFISYMDFDFTEFVAANDIDEFISMPYHKSKLYDFEYDLPQEMACQIAKTYGLGYNKNLIIKIKKTKNQHNLSLIQRKENLKGAFALNDEVKGKNILVIDDIVSTGFSLEEVASTLKKGGAAKVIAVTFAYNSKNQKEGK